jgi:hypothetical protein
MTTTDNDDLSIGISVSDGSAKLNTRLTYAPPCGPRSHRMSHGDLRIYRLSTPPNMQHNNCNDQHLNFYLVIIMTTIQSFKLDREQNLKFAKDMLCKK